MNLKYVATVTSVLLELDSTSLLKYARTLLIENELDMKLPRCGVFVSARTHALLEVVQPLLFWEANEELEMLPEKLAQVEH